VSIRFFYIIIASVFVFTKSLPDAPHLKAENVKERIILFPKLPCHLLGIGSMLKHGPELISLGEGKTSKNSRQMRRFSCLFLE
jgi:hypothetical protein